MTAVVQRSASPSPTGAEVRDVHAWEAGVRRVLRPRRVEQVDGSGAQRHRLIATGVRLGALDAARVPARTDDPSSHHLQDLLTDAHRALWEQDSALPGAVAHRAADDATLLAEALLRFTGAARGRTLFLVPFAARASSAAGALGADLGVLATDSPLAVLALQDSAEVGTAALARVTSGEPWAALVHSVGLPLDDDHGHALRDDAPWPRSERWSAHLRGSAEVWSFGSPVVSA